MINKVHNISLFWYDTHKVKKESGQYFYIKVLTMFFSIQIFEIFIFLSESLSWKSKLKTGFLLIAVELTYLFLFIKIQKALSKNLISKIFFHSIFFNWGIIVNFYFLISPFILISYFKHPELFQYYIYGLAMMFGLAFLYAIQLDSGQVVKNSLDLKGKKEQIIFVPSYVFWPLKKLGAIVWIPYIISGVCAIYGFSLRSDPRAEYYISAASLTLSVICFYSEFCYFWVWVKYRLTNRNNQNLVR